MNNLDFTLLELKDIEGDSKLSIFDKYGTEAAITDFAILLGGGVSNDYHTKEGNDLKNRTGSYFTKINCGDACVFVVTSDGKCEGWYVLRRIFCGRPALSYSSILVFSSNELINRNENIIEFGEYPQTIINEVLSNELEKLYKSGKLQRTGKEYTTDSVNYNEHNKPFQERKHIEYKYNGEKYIRILGDYNSKGQILSDGRKVEEGKPYWIKVEPIVWLIDREKDIAVSKKLLFSGVQFDNNKKYTGDFNSTNMHYFLNNYFSKDIVPSKIEKPKLYLVNFDDEKEKYYPTYEVEDILREFYTNIELIPEDANFIKEDALRYHSKSLVSKIEYYPYISKKIEVDTPEYLNYLFELCVLGKGENIYNLYEKEYIERKVDELVNEQVTKLILK